MQQVKRPSLDRRQVLEAAVRLADRDGLAALSMRRLGAELGVEAMSLYNHVPNKSALLDGIAELVLGEVLASAVAFGDWLETLRAAARAYYRLAWHHPHLYPLVVTRPLNTPDAWRLLEHGIALARAAGFDAETALYAVRTCACYAAGYALTQIARSAEYTTDLAADARLDITKLSADEFPHLAAVAPYYDPSYRDREFEYGLDAILRGLQAKRGEVATQGTA